METELQVHAVALKTLKQRCEYLQERLNAVEEENCKLKLEKAQDLNKRTCNKSTTDLEEQIVILNNEKSQMAHQIKILSSENLALWSQLSELLPVNDISLQNLAFSSVTSNSGSKFKLDKSNDLFSDYSKESLEEISLKLINGILISKNELEKEYSQIIDLQNENNLDVKNVPFIRKQFDKRLVLKNINDHVQKLKDIKQALYQQKNDLSDGIAILKALEILPKQNENVGSGDDVHFRSESENTFSNLQNARTVLNREEVSDDSEKTCPICGLIFTGIFNNFYGHVCEHLSEECDEFVDASSNLDMF